MYANVRLGVGGSAQGVKVLGYVHGYVTMATMRLSRSAFIAI
jgi:hypothetical protein